MNYFVIKLTDGSTISAKSMKINPVGDINVDGITICPTLIDSVHIQFIA